MWGAVGRAGRWVGGGGVASGAELIMPARGGMGMMGAGQSGMKGERHAARIERMVTGRVAIIEGVTV